MSMTCARKKDLPNHYKYKMIFLVSEIQRRFRVLNLDFTLNVREIELREKNFQKYLWKIKISFF